MVGGLSGAAIAQTCAQRMARHRREADDVVGVQSDGLRQHLLRQVYTQHDHCRATTFHLSQASYCQTAVVVSVGKAQRKSPLHGSAD